MTKTAKHAPRSALWFGAFLAVTVYVLISVAIAISTADVCDGTIGGDKTWSFAPPHWECPSRY